MICIGFFRLELVFFIRTGFAINKLSVDRSGFTGYYYNRGLALGATIKFLAPLPGSFSSLKVFFFQPIFLIALWVCLYYSAIILDLRVACMECLDQPYCIKKWIFNLWFLIKLELFQIWKIIFSDFSKITSNFWKLPNLLVLIWTSLGHFFSIFFLLLFRIN